MAWRFLVLLFVLLAPGLASAKCTGNAGDVIPNTSTETYTLGDGTVVPCAGLLIVDESMLRAANAYNGDGSFDFKPSDSYTVHTNGVTYDFGDVYTGNVLDMSKLFVSSNTFNANISAWDTSNVTTMFGMFNNHNLFNGSLSGWDTSSVTNMARMFENAYVFNSFIGDWNTSSVTDMNNMFHNARLFNQDISRWNTSLVENFSAMFKDARVFNSNIGIWNTKSATDMSWTPALTLRD